MKNNFNSKKMERNVSALYLNNFHGEIVRQNSIKFNNIVLIKMQLNNNLRDYTSSFDCIIHNQ